MLQAVERPVEQEHQIAAFKAANRLVASSVAVITARHGDVRNGLTATAVCSVTADPPTMLVCVNREASAQALIDASGAFAINFLSEEQHAIARLFSTSKLAPEERFLEGLWTERVTGAPVLDSAVASFDCIVEQRCFAGTHHIFIGRVAAVQSLGHKSLVYRDGTFHRLTTTH